MVAPSATSEPLSEVHSRLISLSIPHATSPDSVSSSGPVYQSASCEVRPSHYIPLDRLRSVYTIQASPGIARTKRARERSSFLSRSPPLSPFISRGSSSFTRTCSYGQKRIRQKREGSACWIAEPRGVGARIKGAVRLEGAPNYDVTDRTRRDQVSRIQNGLLITESSSPPLPSFDRHGDHHLLQSISTSLYAPQM